jgi:hypothetical protein
MSNRPPCFAIARYDPYGHRAWWKFSDGSAYLYDSFSTERANSFIEYVGRKGVAFNAGFRRPNKDTGLFLKVPSVDFDVFSVDLLAEP